MKILAAAAALAVLTIAAPTVASAETLVVRDGMRDHGRGEWREHRGFREGRAEWHGDRGWHRGWRHGGDRVVVIRRHRHWD
jgi:hypothetical protein